MVDLPEAERPVNQRVKPFWSRCVDRSSWVTEEACQVMLLEVGLVRLGKDDQGRDADADLRRHWNGGRSSVSKGKIGIW